MPEVLLVLRRIHTVVQNNQLFILFQLHSPKSTILIISGAQNQNEISHHNMIGLHVAWWLSGRALDLRFTGRRFNSRPVRIHAT